MGVIIVRVSFNDEEMNFISKNGNLENFDFKIQKLSVSEEEKILLLLKYFSASINLLLDKVYNSKKLFWIALFNQKKDRKFTMASYGFFWTIYSQSDIFFAINCF